VSDLHEQLAALQARAEGAPVDDQRQQLLEVSCMQGKAASEDAAAGAGAGGGGGGGGGPAPRSRSWGPLGAS
jgi:hypothetical protein